MSSFKTKKIPKKSPPPGEVKKISKETLHKTEDKKGWGRHIKICIAIGLLIVSGFFVTRVTSEVMKENKINGSENVNLETIQEIFETKKVEGTTNILLAGIGGKGHDGSDLTDSIMLASLDAERNQVTLLSIPRDLYVAYPDKRSSGRINTLYSLGKNDGKGILYLAEKVSEITGQTIDKYAVIDFSGFKKIVDSLGGVTVDVPEDLIDKEYPDNNWGYETFIVRKGVQDFDGETALKYARSRHSTSDFDRSERQQLIIKSLKDKATDLGVIGDSEKISTLYGILKGNIDTNMSIVDVGKLALTFRDIKSEAITIVNLSDVCLSVKKCQPGSYLYAPSRDLFGGSSVVIPENAEPKRLSYYDDIRRFVDMTFRFPLLRSSPRDIVIIYDASMRHRAQEIGIGLAKLGFPLSFEETLVSATGTVSMTHMNVYWHPELKAGINPESVSVRALEYLEETLPIAQVTRNEYINTAGPKIEIVIGKDANEYFTYFKNPYYIPAPPKPTTSGEVGDLLKNRSGSVSSKISSGSTKNTPKPSLSGEAGSKITNSWENF